MGILGGKKEPEPQPLPMPAPQRQRMRISEQAAVAAQHVIDLEDENEQLRQQYGVALSRIAMLETHIHDLKRSAVELGQERDDYKHHYTYIWGALQNAGAILVECMRVPPRAERNGENDGAIKSALGNLEQELTGEITGAKVDAGADAK